MMPESDTTSPEAQAAAQKAAREKKWQEENREAIEYWNEKTEREGLLQERFRTF